MNYNDAITVQLLQINIDHTHVVVDCNWIMHVRACDIKPINPISTNAIVPGRSSNVANINRVRQSKISAILLLTFQSKQEEETVDLTVKK